MGRKLSPMESELYSRVDEVLHYIWDPIGVSQMPWTREEYRSYLPQVFRLVKEGERKKIVEYLRDIENRCIQLTNTKEKTEQTVDTLLEWKKYLENKYI